MPPSKMLRFCVACEGKFTFLAEASPKLDGFSVACEGKSKN